MRRFDVLFAIIGSFYSAALYRRIFHQWQGIGLSYLFLFNALLITPLVALAILALDNALFSAPKGELNPAEAFADSIITQLPEMEWSENGNLRVVGDETHVIHINLNNKRHPFALIDPDATRDTFDSETPSLILSRTDIFLKKADGTIISQNWYETGFKNFYLDQYLAAHYVRLGLGLLKENRTAIYVALALGGWALLILVMLIWRMVQAALYGIFALAAGSAMRLPLNYARMVRLCTVALTPAILLDMAVLIYTGQLLPLFSFIAIVIAYILFALYSNRQGSHI